MEKSALVFIVLLAGTFWATADNPTETATTSETTTTTSGKMAGSTPTSTAGLKSTASWAPTPQRPSRVSKKEEDKHKDKLEMGMTNRNSPALSLKPEFVTVALT